MGGLAVLFLLGIYIFIAYKVVGLAKTKALKAVALAVILLIPTADAIYGRIKLKQMCAAEGGLKVYRVAEHVEGFMADAADGFYIQRFGYQFTESERTHGKYYRASKQNDQIVIEENVMLKSQYRIRLKNIGDTKDSYLRSQYLVENINTGEILATDTQIGFNGGWVERLVAMFGDGGISPTWCVYKIWMDPANILNNSMKQ